MSLKYESIIKQMSLEEKALMMSGKNTWETVDFEKYGIPSMAMSDGPHGLRRQAGAGDHLGLNASLPATCFPTAASVANSWDETLGEEIGTALAEEAVTMDVNVILGPGLNIKRSPLCGRNFEYFSEDPYHAGKMAAAYVRGIQSKGIAACPKHFAANSQELRRMANDSVVDERTFREIYTTGFEIAVKEGKAKTIMSSYNDVNGVYANENRHMLQEILVDEWGFDGIVLSDCGAIADFYRDYGHKTHPDAESASAAAVLSGTDLECGSSYEALVEAVKQGKIDEKAVDVAVKRLLTARFALGEMDEPEKVSWTGIPFSVVASAGHDSLALDMARKSMTLLMNKDNTLPLKRGGLTVAVMGPNANDSVMQWGNYNGMPPHTVTILDGIRKALGTDDRLIYEQGCGWVERAQIQSVFNRCKTADGKPGFTARYWNNVTRDGEPVTTAQVTTPFHFCTSGATVFAPGVNLTDFSATYNSVFTPDQSGEVVFDIYAYGSGRLRINGEEVRGFSNQHGGQKSAYTLQVQAGKTYDVELDFEYFRSDAQLNFDLGFKNEVDVRKSVERVKDADVVVFVGGVSPNLEGEEMGVELPGFRGGDRTDIELPAVQRELIAALHRAGKKVVLVNCSGSPIGLEPETGRCGAILQAWYPGQAGGTAVAEVLFGDYNPAGRLPVTFYRNVSQLPDFEDYNMTGRTYRYMTQEPLFPFGHGLSYTSFCYGAVVLGSDNIKSGEKLRLNVPVTNTGKCDGEEVVQVYLKKNDDVEGPSKALRAFKRVHIPAGKTVDVEFDLGDKELVWWNPQSNTMCVSEGSYELMVGGSSQTAGLLRRSFVIQP